MSKPTLSVLMSNYNHATYLPESLRSILSQSYQPLEIIIIDSGSTDNSWQVIEAHCRDVPHVKMIRHAQRTPLQDTINELLHMAKGDFVFYVSSDDYILPEFLSKSMAILAAHPQAGLCATDDALLYDETKQIFDRPLRLSEKATFLAPKKAARAISRSTYIISTPATIFRRAALLEMGGWIEALSWQSDDFAKLVIPLRYGMCYVPGRYAIYRMLPTSYSAQGASNDTHNLKKLAHYFTLLNTPDYSDVKHTIARSGIMIRRLGFRYMSSIIMLWLKNRSFWSYLTPQAGYRFIKFLALDIVRARMPNWFIQYVRQRRGIIQ